jgi:hypothetical protein
MNRILSQSKIHESFINKDKVGYIKKRVLSEAGMTTKDTGVFSIGK